MEKLFVSLLFSVFLCAGAAGGFLLYEKSSEGLRSSREIVELCSGVREELQSVREETRALSVQLRQLKSAQERLAIQAAAGSAPAALAHEGVLEPVVLSVPPELGELKASVLAALEEDRLQRDEERQQRRDELRERFETRRQELANLSEGPYERLNLKVNSMGQVLALSEAQKQAFFEVSKQSQDRFQEERRQLAEAARAAREGGGERPPEGDRDRGGRGRGGEEWGRTRELQERIQADYLLAVERMLTPTQREIYAQLPGSVRSFQSLARVPAPGEEASGWDALREGFAAGLRGNRGGGPPGAGAGDRGAGAQGPGRRR
jgi:hypothetical protein